MVFRGFGKFQKKFVKAKKFTKRVRYGKDETGKFGEINEVREITRKERWKVSFTPSSRLKEKVNKLSLKDILNGGEINFEED